MQLERVGAVAMGRVAFQVLGQVDNVDGLERALLDADTATDAELEEGEGEGNKAGVSMAGGGYSRREKADNGGAPAPR